VIDYENIHRGSLRFEFETELFFDGCEDGRKGWIGRNVVTGCRRTYRIELRPMIDRPLKFEMVRPFERCSVKDHSACPR
jgi:hypothetical protein